MCLSFQEHSEPPRFMHMTQCSLSSASAVMFQNYCDSDATPTYRFVMDEAMLFLEYLRPGTALMWKSCLYGRTQTALWR